MSGDLSNIGKSTGGELAGFDKRLKTMESLQEKMGARGVGAERINDALRYTMTFGDEAFSAGANQAMAELEALGYERIKVVNSFRKNSSYKGVNTTFKSPCGQTFEIQFHTETSFQVKQSAFHRQLYEEMRLLDRTDPKWKNLNDQLIENSSKIPNPPGVRYVK